MRVSSLLPHVLLPPGITLVFAALTFKADGCPVPPQVNPSVAGLPLDRWPWLAPAMVLQSSRECKQEGPFS